METNQLYVTKVNVNHEARNNVLVLCVFCSLRRSYFHHHIIKTTLNILRQGKRKFLLMAESAVHFVQRKLAWLLHKRSVLLKDVHDEMKALLNKFQKLERLLKCLEAKGGQNDQKRNFLSDVVRGAYDVDDLVEVLSLRFKDKGPLILAWMVSQTRIVPSTIPTVCGQQSEGISWCQLQKKILALNDKIRDIVVNLQTYVHEDAQESPNCGSIIYYDQHPHLREYRPSSRKNPIIGLEEPMQKLVDMLTSSEPLLSRVVSITGMGGLGKTTLAQCVYNHADVRKHFQFRAWVSISQKYDQRGVLLDLSNQFMDDDKGRTDVERLSVLQLKNRLCQHLQEKRYLVVLDDIWREDAFDDFIGAFPDKANGSRLVVTTRNNQVAVHAGGTTHQMKLFMGAEEGWELFEERALDVQRVVDVDRELQDIGKHIYSKCLRLPLLVAGVGTLIFQNRLTREWQRVLNSMTPLGPLGNLDHLYAILELSYMDLAPEAKSCFLRLAFFPRDYKISTKKLVHIWIADCLVSENELGGTVSMESEAERYLKELIDKNLILEGEKRVDGKLKTCWVHPSIHELSIVKAKEDLFLEIQSAPRCNYSSSRVRHKVIHSESHSYFQSQTPAPSLRSVLFVLPSGTSAQIHNKQLDLICQQFSLLKVLDLQGLLVGRNLPQGIGKLHNLRYLNLRKSGITSLPKSMSHLQNLLTLDIRGNKLNKDSGLNVIQKMRNLRHLYLHWDSESLKFDSLEQLQSIGWISQEGLLENDLQKTQLIPIQKLKLKIPPLRNLGNVEKIWSAMATWNHLESLHLLGSNEEILTGRFSLNIKQLTLCQINISSETMTILAQLPNLTLLRLRELSIKGGALTFNGNDFKCLAYLELVSLGDLKELEGDRVPQLAGLRILHCDHLTRRPKEIAGVLEIH